MTDIPQGYESEWRSRGQLTGQELFHVAVPVEAPPPRPPAPEPPGGARTYTVSVMSRTAGRLVAQAELARTVETPGHSWRVLRAAMGDDTSVDIYEGVNYAGDVVSARAVPTSAIDGATRHYEWLSVDCSDPDVPTEHLGYSARYLVFPNSMISRHWAADAYFESIEFCRDLPQWVDDWHAQSVQVAAERPMDMGPYWVWPYSSDPNGNGPGGDGVDPFSWCWSDTPNAQRWQQVALAGAVMRDANAAEADGKMYRSSEWPFTFHKSVAIGERWPSTDTREFDADWVPWAESLHRYKTFDDQHKGRIINHAACCAPYDPFAQDVLMRVASLAYHYLVAGPDVPSNQSYWSYAEARNQSPEREGKGGYTMGRGNHWPSVAMLHARRFLDNELLDEGIQEWVRSVRFFANSEGHVLLKNASNSPNSWNPYRYGPEDNLGDGDMAAHREATMIQADIQTALYFGLIPDEGDRDALRAIGEAMTVYVDQYHADPLYMMYPATETQSSDSCYSGENLAMRFNRSWDWRPWPGPQAFYDDCVGPNQKAHATNLLHYAFLDRDIADDVSTLGTFGRRARRVGGATTKWIPDPGDVGRSRDEG